MLANWLAEPGERLHGEHGEDVPRKAFPTAQAVTLQDLRELEGRILTQVARAKTSATTKRNRRKRLAKIDRDLAADDAGGKSIRDRPTPKIPAFDAPGAKIFAPVSCSTVLKGMRIGGPELPDGWYGPFGFLRIISYVFVATASFSILSMLMSIRSGEWLNVFTSTGIPTHAASQYEPKEPQAERRELAEEPEVTGRETRERR